MPVAGGEYLGYGDAAPEFQEGCTESV
ncbi:hypothetical protein CCP3SC1AL1_2580003 [Gammaproteobacteria bacterium]